MPHAIGAKTFGNLTGPKTISTQRNYRNQFNVSSISAKKKKLDNYRFGIFLLLLLLLLFLFPLFVASFSISLCLSLSLLRSLAFLSLTFFLSLFLSYSLVWTHTREGTAVCTDTCRSIHLLWCLQVSHTKLAQDRRSRYYLIDRITETRTICKLHHSLEQTRTVSDHFRTYSNICHAVPQQSLSHFLFFQLLIKCLPQQLRFLVEGQSGPLQRHSDAPEVDRPGENRLRRHVREVATFSVRALLAHNRGAVTDDRRGPGC